MPPVSKKDLLKAARQRVQPEEGETTLGPSGGRVKVTTKGPPAPRLPTGKQPAERPRGEPEGAPKPKRHKGSSSRREKEREKGKGKAPAAPAPPPGPADTNSVLDVPALRGLFRQYTETIDLTGSLGTTIGEVEGNILIGHAKLACALRHYMAVVPQLRQKEKEAEKLEAENARLADDKSLLTAERNSLEESLSIKARELKSEKELCEERRRRLEDLQKRHDELGQQLKEQQQCTRAVEESIATEKTKAVADYLGSAEFTEQQTVQTAELLQMILNSTRRRLAKRCPGLDTSFLYAESDEETEVTGAAPEVAPEAGPEAETAGAGLEEGEVGQPIELPSTPPTPFSGIPID